MWRELVAAFPDAEVLHSVWPEESWWKRLSTTIGKRLPIHDTLPLPPHVSAMLGGSLELRAEEFHRA